MSEYHKIQSLYLRDPATKYKSFLVGYYSMLEFEYLKDNQWIFTEKVDGTNVRVMLNHLGKVGEYSVTFGGRTDEAQMPTTLYEKLQSLFNVINLGAAFPDCESVVLYGEGYGARIQKGGGDYISNGVGFILFDVAVGGMFLKRIDVEDVAAKLGIPVAPIVGVGTLADAEKMCREGFKSTLRASEPEGLVMRPVVDLFTRRGDRVITKLKLKDFRI